jgi:exodeoxyribonuclease V alpha subunit
MSRQQCQAVPIDRTKKEHIGSLDTVIWSDAEQPVTIMKLLDGKTVVIGEQPGRFARGQVYRFMGRWDEGKYGPQFRADTFVHHKPHSRLGVVKYLSDFCSGIGTKTAERLHDEYGTDAIEILRTDPAKVAAAGLLSSDAAAAAAKELASVVSLEKTRVDLFSLFAGRGFPSKTIDACITKWGVKAPQLIQRDPYKLITGSIPGCGWKRADKLHAELSLPRNTLRRAVFAGWNAIREDRTGSTWLDAATVVGQIREAAPEVADTVRALRLGIRGGVFRIRRDGEKRWIAIAENARAEQRIADAIIRLRKSAANWGEPIPSSTVEGDGLPSAHQSGEIARGTVETVGCLTGGPGTGKSHSVSFLLSQLVKRIGRQKIAVCAPTGRAASRITDYLQSRALGIRATTIHRLLGVGRSGHDGGEWGFQFNARNPLEQRYLVVDESSMIDTNLMASLLDACADGTHILFVGDPGQLAPVGHGSPLRDMIAAGVPCGHLTEVRRNAGAIVRICGEIRDGRRVELPTRFDFDAADPVNVRMIEAKPGEVLDILQTVLSSVSRFDPVWETQILVATNEKSDLSRKAVNERFAKFLNPDGRKAAGIPFAVGDKVICTKNSQLKIAEPQRGITQAHAEDAERYNIDRNTETYIANGEIGRVLAVGRSGVIVKFDGRVVFIPKSKPKTNDGGEAVSTGAMGDFEHAYAITGHKSQGSQWPLTIVLADKAGGGVADRNWWYTVISRAEKACLIIGDVAAFVQQSTRETITKRKTFLVETIQELNAVHTSRAGSVVGNTEVKS